MTDFNTKYKIYAHRYVYTAPSKAAFTLRDLYKGSAPDVFNSLSAGTVRGHDCRQPIVKDHQDTHRWDSLLLSYGLNATCESVDKTHIKPIPKIEERKPDKLLFSIGNSLRLSGSGDAEFRWPRGLAVGTSAGEIVIADTANHRVQTFNQYGVLVQKFGKLGTREGEFNEPTGVAVTMNGEIVVADKNNRRIQIFTRRKLFKDCFLTNDEPCSVAVDIHYNVIVATTRKTIEVYRRGGRLINRFSTFPERSQEDGPIFIGINDMTNAIIVCDPADRLIKVLNYSGDLLQKFEPCGAEDGLACIPSGIHILLNGHICVCDSLNHTVSVFTEKGEFLRQLIGPTDGCGSVQQCAAGPEGHLITTEYSTNNKHCFKIFRYQDCECHSYRPGSSKRPPTPNRYQVQRGDGSNGKLSQGSTH